MIRILKRLFRMMAQYKKRLYLGIVLSMINNILGIVPIVCGVWVIKTILDDINGSTVLNQNFVFYAYRNYRWHNSSPLVTCLYKSNEAR